MTKDQQPVQPRGGTGTPPHGQVPPQGPAAAPTTEQRLEAAESRMERIEAMVGETGGRIGETLVALIERHNWVEAFLRSYLDWKMNHLPAARKEYIPELQKLVGYTYLPSENPVPPKVEVPETVAEPEDEETPAEESGESTG